MKAVQEWLMTISISLSVFQIPTTDVDDNNAFADFVE